MYVKLKKYFVLMIILIVPLILPLLWVLAAAAVGALIGTAATSGSSQPKISSESNCSEEFLAFNKKLILPDSKIKQLIHVRKVLQGKIKKYFAAKANTSTPLFYIQGSYIHGTLIRKQDDTCDIDVGVYFSTKPSIEITTIQQNLVAAIGDHTDEKPSKKNKCVRVYYANQFHIDLPIYYIDGKQYYFGIGKSDWRPCDPKLFTSWIKEQTKNNSQKIRLVKYFKAWIDVVKRQKKQRMPSGVAFTIWVLNFYQENDREDVAFYLTAHKLLSHLEETQVSNWQCTMPVTPNDNVIQKLDEEQRNNFKKALQELVQSSSATLSKESKEECLENWKSLLGKWFN